MGFERIWHPSYPGGVPPEIEPERITMAEALRRTADRFPNRPALIYLGRKISFRELESLVNRFTQALAALGVRAGDHVATLLPNIPQQVIANHACYRLGAVAVLHDPLLSEQELSAQLNDSGARFLVVLDLLLPRVLAIKAATKIETIIPCHINDYLPFPTRQIIPFLPQGLHLKIVPGPGIHPFLDLIGKQPDSPVPIAARWQEAAAVLYTSGTTGSGKGVVLTHAGLSTSVQQFRAWFPDLRQGTESLLGIYPIFHADGYLLSQNLAIWTGWTNIMIPRPETTVMLDMLKKYRPTLLPGTPEIFAGFLKRPAFSKMDLSFVKGLFNTAEPLAPADARQLKAVTGREVCNLYGLAENGAFATCTPWPAGGRPGSVSLPLPGIDLRIVDPETGTRELPIGELGEICLQGPQLMAGYHANPAKTADALRDGWLFTGDIGFLDREGYLSVVGRKEERIVTAAGSVYPGEIEQALSGHPQLIEVCAYGIPGEAGETLQAAVVVKPGESVTEAELLEYGRERLAADRAPQRIAFLEALPRNAAGKILRRQLREPRQKQQG